MSIQKLSRRRFLQMTGVSGTGLLLTGVLNADHALADVLDAPTGARLNVFVSVDPDGSVEIIAHRSEMGTGIRTSLPQVVADEMEADWQRVKVIQGQANADYGSQNTDGSRSIRNFYQIMRQMGAAARTMLEQAAADSWGVPVIECRAQDHAVHHSDGRSLGFGELAQRASLQAVPDHASLTFKSPDDFRYIGQGLPIVDLHDMTTGTATYGVDVHLEGMLYASIERRPVLGATVEKYDEASALAQSGVKAVVKISGQTPTAFNPIEGVAVVATGTYAAMRARKALNVSWSDSGHSDHNADTYLDELTKRVSQSPGETVRERGDLDTALATAATRVSATYRTPYLAHASMEPPMATARVEAESCEIWACTQTPQTLQREVAKALGLSAEQVTVHVTLLGGGFGRKSKPDYAVEAALLAREVGRPVQVVWTREDDIRHDYFHSCSAQYYEASLDKDGNVSGWLARQATPPISSIFDPSVDQLGDGDMSMTFGSVPFAVPNLRLERHPAPAHTRIGWLRSVYNVPFAFGMGSFVDELAHAAGRDPRDFWLALIGDDRSLDFAPEGFDFGNHGKSLEEYPYDTGRLKNVIRELTASIPWGENLPENQGWGLAAARSFLSYVAVACKVEVQDGRLTVLEMHSAIDAGLIVNPDRVHAQMEGAMVFGLSLVLMGEISFDAGETQQSNFHDYPIARINQVPRVIRTHIIESNELPTGVGEPGVPPVAPSITNAIFAATNTRYRTLPLNKVFRV
ncbi:MAG: molybdopterin cofactor-binding domain-containing protein [Halioglobus sp.]